MTTMQPEFFILLGVDLFLAISLLAALLDRHFPWHLPYLFQIAALAGFGQLMVSKEFMAILDPYTRFWFSSSYLAVALASVVAIDLYLGFVKKLVKYAKVLAATVSAPSLAVAGLFYASYSSVSSHPLVMFPQLPVQVTFVGIVALDTLVVGAAIYLFFKPKVGRIIFGSVVSITVAEVYAVFSPEGGTPVFVVSAIALGVACIIVLSTSVFIFARIWKDNLGKRR
jgi:hypothetical protein